MAKYLETKVVTIADWEEYCHYVAGVVGEGLSRIFSASKLEGEFAFGVGLVSFNLLMISFVINNYFLLILSFFHSLAHCFYEGLLVYRSKVCRSR
jgi:hypothetical protein